MPNLQEIAAERAGVALGEAFSIDEVNLFERLGLQTFVRLSTEFYDRVYADEQQWFRDIFASSPKEQAIQNNYEFMVQRCGGPPLYSSRKGHPALLARHAPFSMTEQAAQRWLHHMEAALAAVPEIDEDSRRRLWAFLRHTAHFLSAGQELIQARQAEQAAAQQQPAAVLGHGS